MKVLLINVAGIGDFFELIRWLYLTKKQKPNLVIDLLVSKRIYDYAKRCPYVNDVFYLDTSTNKVIFSFSNLKTVMKLRKIEYEIIINSFPTDTLRGDLKFILLLWLLKRKKVSTIGAVRMGRYNIYDSNILVNEIDYKNIFRSIGVIDSLVDGRDLLWHLGDKYFDFKYYFLNNSIFINPFSNSNLRNFPADMWIKFIDRIVSDFRFNILLNGDFKRLFNIYNNLSENAKRRICLVTDVNIYEWVYLINKSSFVITVETAIVHISSILGKETIVILPNSRCEIHKPYYINFVKYINFCEPYNIEVLLEFMKGKI